MTRPGIEPRCRGPLVNTQLIWPMARLPKLSLQKDSIRQDKRVNTWLKGICPKVNMIARLEFELAHYHVEVLHIIRYVASAPSSLIGAIRLIEMFVRIHHHHHHQGPLAQISLTLSHHFSLSFIASGTPSGLHPVSSHSCWMYVRAGRPAFARPYVGVHRSTSLMSSSLLLQQCPACLVSLIWIVFVIGGRWLYE